MDYPTISARLRDLKNLADFSRRSGLPLRTLMRIANGRANPMASTIERVAAALAQHDPQPARRGRGAALLHR